MTREVTRITEIVGLLLILILIGWELFFTVPLDAIEQDIRLSLPSDKLDQLHHRQLQLQRHLGYKVSEIKSWQPVHGDPLSEQWNPSPHRGNLKRVAQESQTFPRLKVTPLFAIGSLILIFLKIINYSSLIPQVQPSSPPHEASQPKSSPGST